MTFLDTLVLLIYFVGMGVIGFLCHKRARKQSDYFLGGRRFGKLLQAFAAFGAGTGSADPVNTARTTFTNGLSGMWSVMYWLFVTPFYWITAVWYRRMRHITLGDWFVERYESKRLGAAYAVFGVLFFMVYTSMLLSAIGKVAAPLMGNTLAFGSTEIAIEYVLVPVIGAAVILYGALGGISAAYYTDVVQGIAIILLSVLLIPFGLSALVAKFGDPETMGLMSGFGIMHEQLSDHYFRIVGSTRASDFPLLLIVLVVVVNLLGIAVTPHFIATGGGTAKTEMNARVGLVVGNFAKRFCTVGWALTALIILALMADSPELAADPDKAWGVGSRVLLGSAGCGLVGLMLACLLAALMSSADCYMIVSSALVVRNVYVPYFAPDASDERCVGVAQLTGAIVIIGAAVISLSIMNVFEQLMLTWIVPLVFAAPFWVGMYWRRATTAGAWTAVAYGLLAFFVLPWVLPVCMPGLRASPDYVVTNHIVETTVTRAAAPADIARRRADTAIWDQKHAAAAAAADSGVAQAAAEALGPRPVALQIGDPVTETSRTGGKAIFWSGGVKPDGDVAFRALAETESDGVRRVVQRYDCPLRGQGSFNLDLLVFKWLGADLAGKSDAVLRALGMPSKIVMPFVVMIVASLLSKRNGRAALDRLYVKMKTPVQPDPAADLRELEASYAAPTRFDHRKLFPRSDFEVQRPTGADIAGFVLSFALCFGIIGLAIWVGSIGR